MSFEDVLSGVSGHEIISENGKCLAFLSDTPVKRGHTVIIPKTCTDDLFDIEDETYADLWMFAKETATRLKKSVICKKIGVMVAGLVVRHAHIHLIPIRDVSDLNFNLANKADSDELSFVADAIRTGQQIPDKKAGEQNG